MQTEYSVIVKSDISDENEDPLCIETKWNINGLEITWNGFDMEFEEFFDFKLLLEKNEACYLGGGGNSDWSLNHNKGTDYCTFCYTISGSGGNSSLSLKMGNELVLDPIKKICDEILLYQDKYPEKQSF